MAATKPALASGGITHCRLRWGLRTFFLESDRVVAGLLDNVQFDDLLLEQAQTPTREPLGRRRAGQGDQFRLRRPVENPRPGGVRIVFAGQRRRDPSSTSRRRVRPMLLMLVSNAAEIALSLQPSPASDTSAFSRMRAFVSDCAGCLPAQIIASSCSRSSALSFTTYFLTEISLPAEVLLHAALRSVAGRPGKS